nr:NAP1-related protein 2-like [Ipomoea batatas]
MDVKVAVAFCLSEITRISALDAPYDHEKMKGFSSMATIMSLIIEESEDVSLELLTQLLASVKRTARLGEKVFADNALKLKPYLTQAVKSLDLSLHEYSKVVTSILEGTTIVVEHSSDHTLKNQLTVGSKAATASSHEASQAYLNEEASDKVLEVEQKYSEIRKPVYQKRNDIIKSIPDFWLTAFLSHPVLSELLTEEDQKIFKFLSSIEVEDSKDVKSGYSIIFQIPNGVANEKKGNKRPLPEESCFMSPLQELSLVPLRNSKCDSAQKNASESLEAYMKHMPHTAEA